MRIIPAIDILNGKCVRLTQGNYDTLKVYDTSPTEVAKQYEGSGIKHLHIVDLDGAKSNRIINYKILEDIASKTSLQIDFGGGLKSTKDVEIAFDAGAHQIIGGSIAAKNKVLFEEWFTTYGKERIILGADHLDQKIAINGWTETSPLEVMDFILNYLKKDIEYVICTDISKDGMLNGPSLGLYQEIIAEAKTMVPEYPLKLIASGGISSIADIMALTEIGCEGAIIGKAIYEHKINLSQLEKIL